MGRNVRRDERKMGRGDERTTRGGCGGMRGEWEVCVYVRVGGQ